MKEGILSPKSLVLILAATNLITLLFCSIYRKDAAVAEYKCAVVEYNGIVNRTLGEMKAYERGLSTGRKLEKCYLPHAAKLTEIADNSNEIRRFEVAVKSGEIFSVRELK